MPISLLFLAAVSFAPQTINGIRQIDDPAPKFAQAFVKQLEEEGDSVKSPTIFVSTFFMGKARNMAPLTHTKYTAAQMGICGTMVKFFDPVLGPLIKNPAERIVKGDKDFDTLTSEENAALGKGMTDTPLFIVGKRSTTKEQSWQFFAATLVGMLNAHVTVWHISPTQPTLLKLIQGDLQGCVDQAGQPESASMPEVAEAMKAFSKFNGKKLDEATMREVGKQLEAVLKAATPAKYRW